MVSADRAEGWLKWLLVVAIGTLALQLSIPAARWWRNRPRPGAQVEQRFRKGDRWIGYLLYLPDADAAPEAGWPLVMFLHGGGECGEALRRVRKLGPPRLAAEGAPYPFILVSPQCPTMGQWEFDLLLALIDHLEDRYAIDRRRVYLTGYSFGGGGTWRLAAKAPDRFAAIAPVAGAVADPKQAERYRRMAIWAFHGAQDRTVPVSVTREMVEAVRAAGGEAKMTIYADQGHAICRRVYEETPLFDWMLRQERSSP